MVSFQQQLRCVKAIPHNSKCRHGERGAADAKPKAQIILDAAKVSAASGGNSEPKQGQRSQSARGFCPRSTMRVPQPDIIEHFGNADAVPQLPERCLSRKAGIVRCCLKPIPCHGMRWNGVSCTSAGINCVPRMAFRRGTQLGVYLKSRKFSLFLQAQRDFALKSLKSCLYLRNIRPFLCFQIHHKEGLRPGRLTPVCRNQTSMIS